MVKLFFKKVALKRANLGARKDTFQLDSEGLIYPNFVSGYATGVVTSLFTSLLKKGLSENEMNDIVGVINRRNGCGSRGLTIKL